MLMDLMRKRKKTERGHVCYILECVRCLALYGCTVDCLICYSAKLKVELKDVIDLSVVSFVRSFTCAITVYV